MPLVWYKNCIQIFIFLYERWDISMAKETIVILDTDKNVSWTLKTLLENEEEDESSDFS